MGAVASAPGLALVRGRATLPGQYAAIACASLVLVLLVTALVGMASGRLAGISIPAWSVIPVALAMLAPCIVLRDRQGRAPFPFEWQGFALAGAMVAYGLAIHAVAVRETADGALFVHAWYNADWFKHMGHVAALRNGGIPAGDIFNAMEPLHYYWLSYLLPAAGGALGGDNYAALTTAQAIIVALLCTTIYGTLRATYANRATALWGGALAFLVFAPIGSFFDLLARREGMLTGDGLPPTSALIATTQYIPQHALVLAILLSWFLLDRPTARPSMPLRLMVLGSLASVMTISTLLGAAVLAVYGLLQLWRRQVGALGEVALMAVVSGLLVLALEVVSPGNPSSAIDSPLLTNEPAVASTMMAMLLRMMGAIGAVGLPLIVALIFLVISSRKPRTEDANDGLRFAIVLTLVGITAAALAELLLSPRLAMEMGLRAPFLSVVGIMMILCWAWRDTRISTGPARAGALITLAAMCLIALPAFVVWTAWFGKHGDIYTTIVPHDDRKILAVIERRASPRALVWQYPEPPFLANPSGRDAWVATIAGRAVTGSLRATDYFASRPRIAAALEFYNNRPKAFIAREVSWIYLSRALHPQTYDGLLDRMRAEPDWKQAACYADACLFRRASSERP